MGEFANCRGILLPTEEEKENMEFPNFHAQKTRGTSYVPPGTTWFLLSTLWFPVSAWLPARKRSVWETLVLLVFPHLLVISRDFWSCFPLCFLSICLYPFPSLHLSTPSLGLWVPFLRCLRRPRHHIQDKVQERDKMTAKFLLTNTSCTWYIHWFSFYKWALSIL